MPSLEPAVLAYAPSGARAPVLGFASASAAGAGSRARSEAVRPMPASEPARLTRARSGAFAASVRRRPGLRTVRSGPDRQEVDPGRGIAHGCAWRCTYPTSPTVGPSDLSHGCASWNAETTAVGAARTRYVLAERSAMENRPERPLAPGLHGERVCPHAHPFRSPGESCRDRTRRRTEATSGGRCPVFTTTTEGPRAA